ncbi:MAG: hypothetical protein CVT98_01860 [Bacteroidetes bacterium HGW-Bacteroidetes-15]|nr:MAG: hypothetical protein CVT98_01860 [Bacteroidetes bacterium HGW-Bacteroidetes-15]
MLLKAFRIKNFRSIIDTGWNSLSPDNVTVLIGQNESGKTSVLEGLKSFYDGIITDDILRSDLRMPEVSCMFQIENEQEFPANGKAFPEGVLEKIRETDTVILTRSWTDLNSSQLALNGEEIIALYTDFDNYWAKLEVIASEAFTSLTEKRKNSTDKADSLEQLVKKYKADIKSLESNTEAIEKQLRKTIDGSKKEAIEKEVAQINLESTRLEQKVEETSRDIELIHKEIASVTTMLNIAAFCKELKHKSERALQQVDFTYAEINKAEKNYEDARSEREKKSAAKKVDQFKNLFIQLTRDYESLLRDCKLQQIELKYLLDQKDEFEAKRLAEKDYNFYENILSREDAGQLIFEKIPHFELFEDFSSLLPNRIDLEDMFLEQTNAEGYKAVKNFLVIAGLEPEFFTQTNNRILKQKIENLNNELTVNFQDYWGQKIGKTNKIQIAFELEHYDVQNPEKMGKPYLEFWIKDESERLYPKQRSRGVRWFLSFYLELKASARKYGGRNRILLIDEPGISLHARAQEDVLKVFDDIRDKLQVIFTTHSPNLIDLTKLFRILAVQRAHDAENSETILLNPSNLHSAAPDTLSPIYSLMGVRLSEREFIKQKNNLLVENTVTYYYLSVMLPLAGIKKELSYLPATDSQSIHLLSNVMLGWGLDYNILIFENSLDKSYMQELEKSINVGMDGTKTKIITHENAVMVEDLFSTLDFKKHILKQRVGITESNSEYITSSNLSRMMLASSFAEYVKTNDIKFSDFDDETRASFMKLVERLNESIT